MLTAEQIESTISKYGPIILDGGLASELERRGSDLNHRLWSARLLQDDPAEIQAVHRDFLHSGSMCVTAASYQASFPGFAAEGITPRESERLLRRSIDLARSAVDEFVQHPPSCDETFRPWVAASIGPYGAYLADGSEYRGDYSVSKTAVREFHERRWQVLLEADPDLMACETIPNRTEAEILCELMNESRSATGWISVSCKDEYHLCDGTAIRDVASMLNDCRSLFAIGVNCTSPRFIVPLIEAIRDSAPNKRVVVYPNSGQTYDAQTRNWIGNSDADSFGQQSSDWFEAGATLIGGCCQTGPEHIRAIRKALSQSRDHAPRDGF